MAAFMYEQKKDKTERKLPPPYLGVDPDHQQHCAARLQQDRKKFQERQKNELEVREKLRDHDTHDRDRAQRLFYTAPRRLLGRRLVVLGPFGLNVYVLHFRNVHGV